MRYCLLLLIPLFAGCADKSMTRNFSMSRDSAPENMAATQMPLSMPPGLATRPARPGAFVPSRPDTEATEQAAAVRMRCFRRQARRPRPTSARRSTRMRGWSIRTPASSIS